MSFIIPLTPQTLIFLEKNTFASLQVCCYQKTMDMNMLFAFMKNEPHSSNKQEAILYVLRDYALKSQLLSDINTEKKSKFYTVLLLAFLGFAGAVNNGLGGLDGIISILQLFTNNPYLLYVPGAFFSFISVLIFISFDFNQGAKTLGIHFFEYAAHINNLIEQEKWIKKLIRAQDQAILNAKTVYELDNISQCLSTLKHQYLFIKQQKAILQQKSNQLFPKIIEKICSAICGLLFLFYGYFTGQSGAMFILGANSIAAGMATPFGAFLMLTLGTLAAIGSVAFYVLVQREGVESLISNIIGINREKVDIFCKPERTKKIDKEIALREEAVAKIKKLYTESKGNKTLFFMPKQENKKRSHEKQINFHETTQKSLPYYRDHNLAKN